MSSKNFEYTNSSQKSSKKKKKDALELAKVGALITGNKDDDIVFEVNSDKVETMGPLTWNRTSNYTNHKIHGGMAIPEWTGIDNDQMSLKIYLSAFLGVNPIKEYDRLRVLQANRTLCQLMLGQTLMGYWYVQYVGGELKYIDNQGNVFCIKVQIKLLLEPNPDL